MLVKGATGDAWSQGISSHGVGHVHSECEPVSAHGVSFTDTMKPVCNDHLYDKIYYLWFIQ